VAQIKTWSVGLFLLAGVAGFSLPDHAHAATCDAILGKWAWFIGGEVTVNRDGTFTQQSGNAGTWQCNDGARGRFTFRWRDGGFVNSLVLSPDGQGLSSTDQSQWYVTAQKSAAAPNSDQLVRKDDCCQENYGCETKRIEDEFTKKMAACHFPGNSGCISEATSWKASQLKAANENLLMCNRTASGVATGQAPATGGAPFPASGDEFHSTEGTAGAGQMCQPCGFGTDQAAGGDTFGSNSPGSDKQQPPSQSKPKPTSPVVRDESDCLPQIDAQELERLKAERNDLVRALAGAGYVTDLTLQTMGKLIVARLHHLTEPNEGIVSRTLRDAQSVIEYAPENVVKAGEVVAKYLTTDNAANHRYLYGQVEMAVKKAEEGLKQTLRNPQIMIATAADSILVGKATGAAGTVCRQWTAQKAAQLKSKIDETRKAGKVVKQINKPEFPKAFCGPAQGPEDCFWQSLVTATGDRSYLLKKTKATDAEVWAKLRAHFGGANAKDPLTGRPGDLAMIAEGRPVPVTPEEFAKVLRDMPENSEGMVFIGRPGADGHVVSLAKFRGSYFLWDTQQRTSNMDIIFAGGENISWYRYK
jgi:hypothetical protein